MRFREQPQHGREQVPGDDRDRTIDLRFGFPGDCPSCGGAAALIYIDIGARASRHECVPCDRDWWVLDAWPGEAFERRPDRRGADR